MAKIEQTHLDSYKEDGYLLIKEPVLNATLFEKLRNYSDELFDRVPKKGNGKAPQLIDCPHWVDPVVFDWLFSDDILDLIEPFTGPDIAIFASHFLRKPPGEGKNITWHEDSAYWDKMIQPMEVVSINIAIEPQSQGNGCMKVIPGTHVFGYSDYEPMDDPTGEVFLRKMKPDQIDESKAVYLETEPNQAHIHDARIVHGSEPNTSSSSRSCFAIRYFSTKCKWMGDPESFHIYLARGKDHAGNSFADPEKSYKPAGLI
ncbi:MAG: phytanoyl-CoA dioxygenase family protein [Lentisphaeria bacterium]|nr:phytanoyl-CoA dioxygenase family protein [Lentisphaeria bacterium]NQZ66802.1 phytanoyl-CoA dioxygenase family protein [Lentisphaeria bacterium]